MENKSLKINAVDVYLQKRKARKYVGKLFRKKNSYVFEYNDSYLYNAKSIPIGPDLPLTKKQFTSKNLFTSFEDRIPSSKNPAYNEYCKMVGLDPGEKDPLTLVALLGQKGPSSFVLGPAANPSITGIDIVSFRKKLRLTVREFSNLFDFSAATINRLEKNKTSGKDALKRLEIYLNNPKVAAKEIKKNKNKVSEEKIKFIFNNIYLQNHKIVSVKTENKKQKVMQLLQRGSFFLGASKILFGYPFIMYTAAVQAHHGFELLLKACWIWDKNQFEETHSLPEIAKHISFLKLDNQYQRLLEEIDTFYYFRYPYKPLQEKKISETVLRISSKTGSIQNLPGEIGTDAFPKIEELYDLIIKSFPVDLSMLWKEIENNHTFIY